MVRFGYLLLKFTTRSISRHVGAKAENVRGAGGSSMSRVVDASTTRNKSPSPGGPASTSNCLPIVTRGEPGEHKEIIRGCGN